MEREGRVVGMVVASCGRVVVGDHNFHDQQFSFLFFVKVLT